MKKLYYLLLFKFTKINKGSLKFSDLFCAVLLSVLLASCSTSKINRSPTQNQQLKWLELKQQYPVNKSALKDLLLAATLSNNWKLMWLIELELCQIEIETQLKQNACEKLQQMALIFYDDKFIQFETSLVLYEQFKQAQDLANATTFVATEAQKINLLLAQDLVPTQKLQKSIKSNSLQEARLLYLLGKTSNNIAYLSKAAQLFKQFKQINKQADSLFLLATLQWADSQKDVARSNAVKSLMLHLKSGNVLAVKSVRGWLDEH